jgi:hypothetical protein
VNGKEFEVIELAKKDSSTFKLMAKIAHGGMVTSAATAHDIATAILKGHHGGAELAKQQPLKVADEGESWLVRGSHQEPGEAAGVGAWFIRIMKDDARIVRVHHQGPRLDSPEKIKPLIEQSRGAGNAEG